MNIQSKKLDGLEAGWKDDIKSGKITSDKATIERLSEKLIVDQALKKTHPLSLRIPDVDLEAIQLKAARAGMPYQTLIKSVLHKFATNQVDL